MGGRFIDLSSLISLPNGVGTPSKKLITSMGRSATGSLLPESGAPAITSPKTIIPSPSSERLPPKRARQLRRRIKNLPFRGERRSGPAATPLLRWNLGGEERTASGPGGKSRPVGESDNAGPATAFSARKLAARLWHLQGAEVGGAQLDLEVKPRHLQLTNVLDRDRTSRYSPHTPISPSQLTATFQKQLEASATRLCFAREKATKWDARRLSSAYRKLDHKENALTTASVISVLQAELEQARYCINKLENERGSAKRKLNHLLKKLADETASWKSRERENNRNIIQFIRHDLSREKKSRKKMEIMKSKLASELAEAKLSAKNYFEDYENERKARELTVAVCDELDRELGDAKIQVETLKRESMKIREELDEERRMLQMAEVWREERVQMKLVDAKVTLEEKYAELNELQHDLRTFLRLHSSANANLSIVKEAEALRESLSLLKFQDIEFRYQPPPSSGDIFSVFEEFRPGEEANEKEVEQCRGCSPKSHASEINSASPETDIFLESPTNTCAINRDEDARDDSGLETMSNAEGQGSCNSPEGNDLSANVVYEEESHLVVSSTDWNLKRDDRNPNSGSSEVCSRTTGQSRKKVSSIGKFWRSSSNKKAAVQVSNGKLTNSRMLNAALSPDMNSGEVDSSSPSVCLQRSSDSINPDIKDHSLKKKLLEARTESDMRQLRQVFKHKS
ncbi:hypothetical protein Cni_G08461 [Canna indica]|uniref:Uncharacterized protein n=1 Tax=Canna indica TaxID=4628 RepID=A0AAQ3K2F7_9LILI|nr:hypothetical protein Cni_G08461 [Canna indica]